MFANYLLKSQKQRHMNNEKKEIISRNHFLEKKTVI